MRSWLLGLPVLFVVACSSAPGEDAEEANLPLEGASAAMACAPVNVFALNFRLYTRDDGTAVLRREEDPKDIGDPSSFATLEVQREVVIPAADLAAAKKAVLHESVWAGLLDPPGEPNLAATEFRRTRAQLFVDALRCSPGAPPAATTLAEPLCSTPVKDGEPTLTISQGPDFTGETMFPTNRSTFAFAFEVSPWSVDANGSVGAIASMRRILRISHLREAPAGIASARAFIPVSPDHLDWKFFDRLAAYAPLDARLVCK